MSDRAQRGDLSRFVRTAREFCAWCGARRGDSRGDVRTLTSLLVRLQAQILSLRLREDADLDVDGERTDGATWSAVFRRAGALPFDCYAIAFDPHVLPPESPVVGSLADDVADIHRDLDEGLSLFDRGHAAEAEWAFVHSFRSHWGRHAAGALHALHCWSADHDLW